MIRRKTGQASELELQVLTVLWEKGPSTARAVLEAMPDGKPRAYTTVLTFLQIMEKKGLVRHKASGKAHVYSPVPRRQQVLGPLLQRLARTVFGGSPSSVLQCLLDEQAVSPTELAEIQRVIGDYEAARRGRKEPKK